MKTIAQQQLTEAVRRYGREIASDERRCEAVLKDLCGGDANRREVHLLMCAVRGGAVGQLLAGGNGVPQAVLEVRLIKRLCDDFGVSEELAGWSVKSWIIALGLKVPSNNAESRGQTDLVTVIDYLVVDLSDGPTASKYPLTTLSAIPIGGWTDEYKTTKMVFRRIPAGTFTMGSPTDELGRMDNETQHQVTLTQPFYIGVFEVTQKQWEQVMGNKKSHFKNAGPNAPVEQVSWNDCQTFIEKLNQRPEIKSQQVQASLPTEAQWEYACRAGTTTQCNSGDEDSALDQTGWYSCNSGNTTHPAGQKTVNAWGLYDMHGNVYEWCQDWYGNYDRGAVTDPIGPSSGSGRVLRGGSWGGSPGNCRSANRIDVDPALTFIDFGFRVVCCR